MERKLTTILVADVVGYSRLMAADEDRTLEALQSIRTDIMEPETASHHGRLVKLMGDGTLMAFESVVDAVAFAVDVQKAISNRNKEIPRENRLEFRIGINIGDVLVDGDDLYGDGVNVAARLESIADPGGICVSDAVRDQATGKVQATFEDLGRRSLKNIAEPRHVYRIAMASDPAAPRRPRRPRPPRLEEARGSIAVLPFESLSSDPDDRFLVDGIESEIVTLLARIPDLRVASRAALSSSGETGGDSWRIAQELRFLYVLTGNVRRAGDRIRVIAELTEVAGRTQIWSGSFNRTLADIFAVQEEIAEAIVTAVGGEYMRAEWRRVSAPVPDNLNAWELVQRSRALNLPVNRTAIEEALDLAHEAVAADPGYAGAHACVASSLVQRVISGFSADPEADRAAALAAVERAGELAPNDPHVLRTLGKVYSTGGRHQDAVAALRRAVDIAPFDFHSWGRLGRTLCYGGDPDGLQEGQAILDRILAAAPNHPMVPYWLYFKANACALEERFEDAVRYAQKSLDIQPGYAGAWTTLANALGRLDRFDEARQAMERAQRANPALTPEHLVEQIRVAAGGDAEHAARTLAGLKAAGLL